MVINCAHFFLSRLNVDEVVNVAVSKRDLSVVL